MTTPDFSDVTGSSSSSALVATDELPKYVKTAEGGYFEIPAAGDPSAFSWPRQAGLVRNAFRAVGDSANAQKWSKEYERRVRIWRMIGEGKDAAEVLLQFGKDLLVAPVRVLEDVGNEAIDLGKNAKKTLFSWAEAIPLIVIGIVIVLGVAFYKGTLRVKV